MCEEMAEVEAPDTQISTIAERIGGNHSCTEYRSHPIHHLIIDLHRIGYFYRRLTKEFHRIPSDSFSSEYADATKSMLIAMFTGGEGDFLEYCFNHIGWETSFPVDEGIEIRRAIGASEQLISVEILILARVPTKIGYNVIAIRKERNDMMSDYELQLYRAEVDGDDMSVNYSSGMAVHSHHYTNSEYLVVRRLVASLDDYLNRCLRKMDIKERLREFYNLR